MSPRTAPCPRCGDRCEEFLSPFGYSQTPRHYSCDNCEQGDSPDGSRAMGPLVFREDEAGPAPDRTAASEVLAAWDMAAAAYATWHMCREHGLAATDGWSRTLNARVGVYTNLVWKHREWAGDMLGPSSVGVGR